MRGSASWAITLVTALAAGPAAAVAGMMGSGPALRCAGPSRTATPVSAGVPWTQQRLAVHRLPGLADGRGVTVAVIDSGTDAGHPQLTSAVIPGSDLLADGDGTVDCVSHGTAVASIVAARPAAGTGFRGLAPAATILPVRVSEHSIIEGGTPTGRSVGPARFAEAIRYAVAHGAGVVNLSVVLYRDDPAVRAAITYAHARDVVIVAAVGNRHASGDPTPYPAGYPGVIGVGAIGPAGTRLASSQVGSYVDVVAPGGQVTAAASGGGHGSYDGTSFATPFVAATAALLRQYRPDERAPEVTRRILATTDPTPGGPSAGYGEGLVNPYRAVTEPLAGRAAGRSGARPGNGLGPAGDGATADGATADGATTDGATTDGATTDGGGHHARAGGGDRAGAHGGGRGATADSVDNRRLALRLAGGGALAVAVILALAGVIPRGAGRRWRAP